METPESIAGLGVVPDGHPIRVVETVMTDARVELRRMKALVMIR